MAFENNKKNITPPTWFEIILLFLVFFLVLLLGYYGIFGEINCGLPNSSENFDGKPINSVKEPVFVAGAVALFIATVNIYFARIRLNKHLFMQLNLAKRADIRQSAEWREAERRQWDFVEKEKLAYEKGLKDVLIFELTRIIGQTETVLENVDYLAKQLHKNGDMTLGFTFTRFVFETVKEKLPDLSKPFREIILEAETTISPRVMFMEKYLEGLKRKEITSDVSTTREQLLNHVKEVRDGAINYVLLLEGKDNSLEANAQALLQRIKGQS